MLAKWNGKLIAVIFLLNLTLLGLSYMNKGRLWNMAKSTWKSEFYSYVVCLTRAQRSATPSESFAISSFNKDQLKDLQNY